MSSKIVSLWNKKIKYLFQMHIYKYADKANTNSLPDQTNIKAHITLDDILIFILHAS